MTKEQAVLRDKTLACWTGKAIGGAVGAPFEGVPDMIDLSVAHPVWHLAIPNDDLQLQLVWLCLVEKHGVHLNSTHFAEAWQNVIQYGMDEYGVAKWNLNRGLPAPLTGSHNNWFRHGMGAAIRSEIWACVFPQRPEIAAHFACMDASVDHAGEGIWAEMFLAAAQSAAFRNICLSAVIAEGLNAIPATSRVAEVVRLAQRLVTQGVDLVKARATILAEFGSHNFTDCVMNLGFIVWALLHGKGNFEKSVRAAVSFGMDTDCTGATVGAFVGILGGAQALQRSPWTLATEELASDAAVVDIGLPKTISDLTDRVAKVSAEFTQGPYIPPTEDLDASANQAKVHDAYEWVIVTNSGDPFMELDEPSLSGPLPDGCCRVMRIFPQIHLCLDEYCREPQSSIYLFSNLTVPVDVAGSLMICADTGITAWLEGECVLNYHGRRKAVPACHRVEGGGCIPVQLQAQRAYALKIRLLFCAAPLSLSVAVFDANSQYAPGFELKVERRGVIHDRD